MLQTVGCHNVLILLHFVVIVAPMLGFGRRVYFRSGSLARRLCSGVARMSVVVLSLCSSSELSFHSRALVSEMVDGEGGRPTQRLLAAFIRVWDGVGEVLAALFGLLIAICLGAIIAR